MWFLNKVLPVTWIEDSDIIPYFTPCTGHNYNMEKSEISDVIDGVFPMQAYCLLCKH